MKKMILLFFIGISLVFGVTALFTLRETTQADDGTEKSEEREDEENEKDEKDEEDERNGDDEEFTQITQKAKTTTTTSPTATTTITMTPEKTTTTIIKDSDADGVFDNDDSHPNIPEHIIVLDDNKNGIVDTFEYPSHE